MGASRFEDLFTNTEEKSNYAAKSCHAMLMSRIFQAVEMARVGIMGDFCVPTCATQALSV
jgi:hypothetical protein